MARFIPNAEIHKPDDELAIEIRTLDEVGQPIARDRPVRSLVANLDHRRRKTVTSRFASHWFFKL